MTISRTLKEVHKSGKVLKVNEVYDKNYRHMTEPYYEIILCDEGQALIQDSNITRTARTTWRRKFKELEQNL